MSTWPQGWAWAAAVLCALVLSATRRAEAQEPEKATAACAAVLKARGATESDAPCHQVLANRLVTALTEPGVRQAMLLNNISPRDLQSRASGDPSAAGPGGSEAVPTVQPVALAAASIAAVGTGGGNDAISAISLNPLMLFLSPDPKKQLGLSRITDITLLTPVNHGDTGRTSDYLGVRIRVNVVRKSRERVEAAAQRFGAVVALNAHAADELESLLKRAPSLPQCVEAYEAGANADTTRIVAACGGYVKVVRADAALQAFRSALQALRDSVDRDYLGLDIRYDRGDPSLGEVPGFSGNVLSVALAFGRRLSGKSQDATSLSLRGRLGVSTIAVDSGVVAMDTTGNSVDGALAFEFEYPHEFRPMRLIGGLDYTHGTKAPPGLEPVFHTGTLNLRASIELPVTPTISFVVSYASPIRGETRPRLSINLNWQMLLPELAGIR